MKIQIYMNKTFALRNTLNSYYISDSGICNQIYDPKNKWRKINGQEKELETASSTIKSIFIYVCAYKCPFSSNEDSEEESSTVEFEVVSNWLEPSLSDAPLPGLISSTGCFMNQYIMLAVKVRIIF